jgi:hypothetical protein
MRSRVDLPEPFMPKDADLGAVEVGEGDVLEDGLLVVELAHPDHGVDDLVRFVGCS